MAPTDVTLQIGEEAKLRSSFAGGWWLVYAGMPNGDTYSVAIRWASGNNAAAYNLYLATGQSEFMAAKGRVRVYSVSPRDIRFRFSK